LEAAPSLIDEVFGHLSRLQATNLNVARVFVPTMSTITQIMSSDLLEQEDVQDGLEYQ
jgi:hypothetical protein